MERNPNDSGRKVLTVAKSYIEAGLSIIPIAPDGSKRPAIDAWKRFQKAPPAENQVLVWWGDGSRGIGIVGGAVSGGLEQLDFDLDAATIYPAWCQLVQAEAPGLVASLCVAATPNNGFHVRYRSTEIPIPGNTKLAMRPKSDGKAADVLIETRGEGGYAIAPGSPSQCHPTGRLYVHHNGPPLTEVPTITAAQRDVLIRCAQSFDETPVQPMPNGHAQTGRKGLSAGDDYCARGPDWAQILEPHGWQIVHQRDAVRYWRRPGKDKPGWSATTGACTSRDGRELFVVFSSSAAPFDGPVNGRNCSTYSRFSAYTLLNHQGDFKAAARELARNGFGEEKRRASSSGLLPHAGMNEDSRPTIVISTEEHEVNAEAVAALARDDILYQRGGILVRVVRDVSPAAKGIRRPFAPRIEPLPAPLLRERLAASAEWVTIQETKDGPVEKPSHPPAWCVAAVHARAHWPGIRHLEAVVDYPVLRPDGTILSQPGYDPHTGLLLESSATFPTIPDRPSRADAIAACSRLLDAVADFPFERKEHQAAWLAALLTPLSRFAFIGPSPLFLVDSNVRGAGKGLLLDCISRIVTGERFTIATYTHDEEELRKRITSLVLAGDRLVLFDNLDGQFGNAVLDAALTGMTWKDRLLGINRMAEAPMLMTWYATGNNVAVAADTARRICHIRLESPEERPEERKDFKRPNLLMWVGERRAELLVDALTIMRAYFVDGRPDMSLPAWGSFEGWSRIVRSAVVWCEMPDPGETRLLLRDRADVIAEGMVALMFAWEQMDAERKGLTAAEVVHQVFAKPERNGAALPEHFVEMRDAIESLVGRGDARALGYKLRSYRRRLFQGKFFDHVAHQHKTIRWAVFPAHEFSRRGKTSPLSPPSSLGNGQVGGDDGDGGDDSPQAEEGDRHDEDEHAALLASPKESTQDATDWLVGDSHGASDASEAIVGPWNPDRF
jgi:hypothetical protein